MSWAQVPAGVCQVYLPPLQYSLLQPEVLQGISLRPYHPSDADIDRSGALRILHRVFLPGERL